MAGFPPMSVMPPRRVAFKAPGSSSSRYQCLHGAPRVASVEDRPGPAAKSSRRSRRRSAAAPEPAAGPATGRSQLHPAQRVRARVLIALHQLRQAARPPVCALRLPPGCVRRALRGWGVSVSSCHADRDRPARAPARGTGEALPQPALGAARRGLERDLGQLLDIHGALAGITANSSVAATSSGHHQHRAHHAERRHRQPEHDQRRPGSSRPPLRSARSGGRLRLPWLLLAVAATDTARSVRARTWSSVDPIRFSSRSTSRWARPTSPPA